METQTAKKRIRKIQQPINFQPEVLEALKMYCEVEGLSVCAGGNSIIRKFLISNNYLKPNK